MGVGTATTRRYIAWPPDPPSEPTSTLVLTSPAAYFVDIRILLTPSLGDGFDEPVEALDWAFAGTSSTAQPLGREARDYTGALVVADVPARAKWTHWVDSRVPLEQEAPSDEGDIFPGETETESIERGRMLNPETGRVAEYEECWVAEEIRRLEGEADLVCVVLRLEHPRHPDLARGMVVRVGQWCQGIAKVGEEVSVERWQWRGKESSRDEGGAGGGEEDGRWERTFRIGRHFLPCATAFRPDDVREGDVVRVGAFTWKVMERSGHEESERGA